MTYVMTAESLNPNLKGSDPPPKWEYDKKNMRRDKTVVLQVIQAGKRWCTTSVRPSNSRKTNHNDPQGLDATNLAKAWTVKPTKQSSKCQRSI